MHLDASDTPLRGRVEEMACLTKILEFCRDGGTALITLEGPIGMGKTRLLRESLRVASGLGLSVALTTLDKRRAARLSRARQVSMAGRPAVMAFDNAHHLGDEAVNALVSENANSHYGTPTAWILARRTRAGAPPLDNFISSPVAVNRRIALGPLDAPASLAVCTDVLGAGPSPELTRVLLRAGGHPRRLHELVEGMREERSIAVVGHRAELVEDRIPRRLTQRVHRSLLGYSDAFRQMVRVAATLGREVSFGQVADMMQRPPLELLPVLDELVSAGVLVHQGDKLVFCDELLWRLISDWMPPTVQAALQRQAAAQHPLWHPADPPGPPPADDRGAPDPPGFEIDPETFVGGFTEKQSSIIRLVCEGLTNQRIARQLRLSPHTVNYHLRKIFRVFGVNSRVELIRAVQQRTGRADEVPEGERQT